MANICPWGPNPPPHRQTVIILPLSSPSQAEHGHAFGPCMAPNPPQADYNHAFPWTSGLLDGTIRHNVLQASER